jgi:ABC-type branched-subunit amino acid transport system permease subunit
VRNDGTLLKRTAGFDLGLAGVVFLGLALIPLLAGTNVYLIRLAGMVGLYATLALGLNVVTGFAGVLDLGYVAFYGIGAYTYALLSSYQLGLHLPFWASLPLTALAGLAGALQVQGIQYRFIDLFSFPGYGFDGMTVALLGNNHPAGILVSALLFGAMNSGALQMQSVADISKNLVGVIQAVIIFFVAADYVVKQMKQSKLKQISSASPQTPPSQATGKENV